MKLSTMWHENFAGVLFYGLVIFFVFFVNFLKYFCDLGKLNFAIPSKNICLHLYDGRSFLISTKICFNGNIDQFMNQSKCLMKSVGNDFFAAIILRVVRIKAEKIVKVKRKIFMPHVTSYPRWTEKLVQKSVLLGWTPAF